MKSGTYNSKELLSTLMEVEVMLNSSIEKHCPVTELTITEDLDRALDDFLNVKNKANEDVAYLSSQLALLHLRRELEKAMGLVVETNNLRAFYDFHKDTKKSYTSPTTSGRKMKVKKWFFSAICGGIIITVITFFFVIS